MQNAFDIFLYLKSHNIGISFRSIFVVFDAHNWFHYLLLKKTTYHSFNRLSLLNTSQVSRSAIANISWARILPSVLCCKGIQTNLCANDSKTQEVCTYNVTIHYNASNAGIYQKFTSPTIKYFWASRIFSTALMMVVNNSKEQFQQKLKLSLERMIPTWD